MKSFFSKLLLLVLPVGALVIGTNFLIDPANLFSSKAYVSGIAEILVKGHNVDNVINYDERLLQEAYVGMQGARPDIAVIGSSRIMEIGTDFFAGRRVWNLGVSHANINDILAIVGLLEMKGKLPSELFINIDDGLFSKESTNEWESIASYRNYLLDQLQLQSIARNTGESLVFKRITSLVSPQYFQESLSFKLKGYDKKYKDVGKDTPTISGRFYDGSISYSESYVHPDTGRVAKVAVNTARTAKKIEADTTKEMIWIRLVDFLQKKNVKLTILFIPYHPDYFAGINQRQGSVLTKFEEEIKRQAEIKNINTVGSLNSALFNITKSDFYDPYHCSKKGIQQIFINSRL